jgi:transcriptional regulator, Rrf2 family
MLVSSKGRYAARILLDLAERYGKGFVSMRDVAERQELSVKYAEKIVSSLKKAGLIKSSHGFGGGYQLSKAPGECTLWETLIAAEGELVPVSCLSADAEVCEKNADCKTLPIWKKYYDMTKNFFKGITLADILANG